MKLTDIDIKLFQELSNSSMGKDLVDYMERLILDMFSPDELTKENLDSKKEASSVIRKELIDRIRLSGKAKANGVDNFS
jgi:hypothetical protein